MRFSFFLIQHILSSLKDPLYFLIGNSWNFFRFIIRLSVVIDRWIPVVVLEAESWWIKRFFRILKFLNNDPRKVTRREPGKSNILLFVTICVSMWRSQWCINHGKNKCHTLFEVKKYFLRWFFVKAIKDELGFKNEIMTDFVVDNMHLFDRFKRRCNAFSPFFIITHLNDSNISYRAYVIDYGPYNMGRWVFGKFIFSLNLRNNTIWSFTT